MPASFSLVMIQRGLSCTVCLRLNLTFALLFCICIHILSENKASLSFLARLSSQRLKQVLYIGKKYGVAREGYSYVNMAACSSPPFGEDRKKSNETEIFGLKWLLTYKEFDVRIIYVTKCQLSLDSLLQL